jgi:hypothetical protein
MNTFDENTGLFRQEEPNMEFTIAMVDDQPGLETFRIDGCLDGEKPPLFNGSCSESELLQWLGRFLGNNDEGLFRHIIERIKMDRRQNEGSEDTAPGSFM